MEFERAIAEFRELPARIRRIHFFVNQTPSPIHVLQASAVPIELVGTIDPFKFIDVSMSDGDHFVFGNINTRQAMLFTSESEPDLRSGYILKLGDDPDPTRQIFLLSAPSEVSTLKEVCVESVFSSVDRSVATIDQLPLPQPLKAQLKDAAENPSDYVLAKKLIVRYISALP